MIFACITPDEARAKYARAQDKEAMIGVLADLTASTRAEVRKFLGVEKKARKEPKPLDEAAARQLYDQGMNDPRIASRLETSASTVCLWRKANGLPPIPAGNPVTDNRMELYEAGMTDPEIAREVGAKPHTIFEWRKRMGLPANGTRGGDRRSKKARAKSQKGGNKE